MNGSERPAAWHDGGLTVEERAGGWTPEDLAAYRRERDRVAGQRTVGSNELVRGLVVTEFQRPRPRGPVLEGPGIGSKHYSPWRWSRGG